MNLRDWLNKTFQSTFQVLKCTKPYYRLLSNNLFFIQISQCVLLTPIKGNGNVAQEISTIESVNIGAGVVNGGLLGRC